MGKRYIRYFGIPDMNEAQLAALDAATEKEDVEEILYPCYFGRSVEQVRRVILNYWNNDAVREVE